MNNMKLCNRKEEGLQSFTEVLQYFMITAAQFSQKSIDVENLN